MKVGGIRPLDEIEHLVLPGAAGELFKSLLGDERHLDVSPCGKLNKSVAKAGLKTMQGEGFALLATHYWLLICGVQAEGQHPRASVAVKHQVLIGLDRKDRQLLRSTQENDSMESAMAQLGGIHLEANPCQGGTEAQSRIKSNLH